MQSGNCLDTLAIVGIIESDISFSRVKRRAFRGVKVMAGMGQMTGLAEVSHNKALMNKSHAGL
jgi:hypothetical protein